MIHAHYKKRKSLVIGKRTRKSKKSSRTYPLPKAMVNHYLDNFFLINIIVIFTILELTE